MYSIVETGGPLLVPNWSSSPFFFSQEKKCKSAPLS